MKLWLSERIQGKMIREAICDWASFKGNWSEEIISKALTLPCKELDISRPIVLNKHILDMNRCGRTVFKESDFMESISFDSLVFEVIPEDGEAKIRSGSHMYSEL